MRIERLNWTKSTGWQRGTVQVAAPKLVFYFGAREVLISGAQFFELKGLFPEAHILGCSTGGHIAENEVTDANIVAVAMSFANTELRVSSTLIDPQVGSRVCGAKLGMDLNDADLAGVFLLSDGISVNGSELIAGIASVIGNHVPITGGLAGDGSAFVETVVGVDAPPAPRIIAAVGFYGSAIRFGTGSAGGWDVFGPQRRITRSMGNVLFEFDGKPALELYERYLGEEAKDLPSSALLFPLKVFDPTGASHGVVRTILAIDREAKSMTFAGDVPEGWTAQLMRGNFEHLCVGAADAAKQAIAIGRPESSDMLALLVSCIGRRLLMGQRISEELEAVGSILGPKVMRVGFYSYGELCPQVESGACELHNQTMTITTIAEAA